MIKRSGMKPVIFGLLFISSMLLHGCGGEESKVYGYWHNKSEYNYFNQKTTYHDAMELTKDTYRSGMLSTNPKEYAIKYEKKGDRLLVKDLASDETYLVLQDIKDDSITDIQGETTVWQRTTKQAIDELEERIKQNKRKF